MTPDEIRREQLDELLDEFEQRVRAGEDVEPDEYRDRSPDLFPEFLGTVRRLQAARAMLAAVGRPAGFELPAGSISSSSSYHSLKPLAEGGLGVLYEAWGDDVDRPVALKFLKRGDAEARSRFLQEARVTARLEHPGVVPIYGVGRTEDGSPCYVMRLIRGRPLSELIAAANPADAADDTIRALIGRLISACATVAFAHSRGVIHRDLKPDNIMVDEYDVTLVVDWGLAKIVGEPDAPPRDGPTGDGAAVTRVTGSLGFRAPEQLGDPALGEVGPATDVFGLGATLYAVLTAQPPWLRPTVADAETDTRGGRLVPPRTLRPDVPAALDAICRKALAHRPADRYDSPLNLAADLRNFLEDRPISVHPSPLGDRLRRWAKRHRTAVMVASVAGLVGLVSLSIATALLAAANASERAAQAVAVENARTADANFRTGFEAVNAFFTRVADEQLLNTPGLQPIRRQLLSQARDYYARFLERRGDDRSLGTEVADATFRLGRITGEVGDRGAADASLRQATALAEALIRADPGNTRARMIRAKAMAARGYLAQLDGDLTRARFLLEAAVPLCDGVARDAPLDRDASYAVVNARFSFGQVLRDLHDCAAAQTVMRPAVAEVDRRLGDDPRDLRWRSMRAVSFDLLCQLDRVAGQLDRAESAARSAVAAWGDVVKEQDTQPFVGYRASSLIGLAMVLIDRRQLAEAAGFLAEAVAIRERLYRENPSLTIYQTDLVTALGYQGQSVMMTNPDQAKRLFDRSRELCDLILAKNPNDMPIRLKRFGSVDAAAHLDAAQGEAGKVRALQAWDELDRQIVGVLAEHPDNPTLRGFLVQERSNVAHTLDALGRPSEEAWRSATVAGEDILGRGQPPPPNRVQIAEAYGNLGNKVWGRGAADDAAGHFGRAIAILDGLPDPNRDSKPVRATLGQLLMNRAECLAALSDYAAALRDWERAETLRVDGAASPLIGLRRAWALAKLGDRGRAAELAEGLEDRAGAPAMAYDLAVVFATLSQVASDDARLPAVERVALTERYAAKAVALLTRSEDRGTFAGRPAGALAAVPEFAPLAGRPDFRGLSSRLDTSRKALEK